MIITKDRLQDNLKINYWGFLFFEIMNIHPRTMREARVYKIMNSNLLLDGFPKTRTLTKRIKKIVLNTFKATIKVFLFII
jgi:hypothetical protein